MEEEIEVPSEVDVEIKDSAVKVSGEKGEVHKELFHPLIKISKKGDKIKITSESKKKQMKALIGTYKAHIENMFMGVTEGFEYKLKAVFEHFPMSLESHPDKLVIKNFLGEKSPREAEILEGVEVDVDEQEITVTGIDKEKTGQTAANIERTADPGNKKDRRIFSDGIYIVKKP
ncbi:MAG: 50S ribosomal protein L6 [Candidatus Aenigmatarchaeota archaeon]